MISLLVGCIAFCGTVSAATIQSPSDGATFNVNKPIAISVKTGYSSTPTEIGKYTVKECNNANIKS